MSTEAVGSLGVIKPPSYEGHKFTGALLQAAKEKPNFKDCIMFLIYTVRFIHDCHTFEITKLFLAIHFLSACISLINSCWISGGNALKSSESMFILLGS